MRTYGWLVVTKRINLWQRCCRTEIVAGLMSLCGLLFFNELSCACIPDAQRAVCARTGESSTIGAEGQVADFVRMTLQSQCLVRLFSMENLDLAGLAFGGGDSI